MQVQGIEEQFTLAGAAPPTPTVSEDAEMVTVVMERNRGGPLPNVISGLRWVPLRFTVISGAIFFILCWALHTRSKREDEVLAGA